MKSLASAGTVSEIRERIGAMTESDRARWGVMTVTEAVVHLRQAFLMATGERRCEAVPMPLPGSVMKFLALRMPVPWPKGVPTVPGLERSELVTESLARDREGLLEAYDRFLGVPSGRPAHPMFGAMSRAEWMRWGYLHTDHHLRQFGR